MFVRSSANQLYSWCTLPFFRYSVQPPKYPAWAMMTPLAFASFTSTSAVTVWCTPFTLMKAFSIIPVMPG